MSHIISKSNEFDIMSVAKEELFYSLSDPVLVVDENNRLVDMNHTALELLKITPSRMGAADIKETLESFPILATAIERGRSSEIDVGSYWGVKHFKIEICNLNNGKDRIVGKLVIMRNITKQKRLEREVKQVTSAP